MNEEAAGNMFAVQYRMVYADTIQVKVWSVILATTTYPQEMKMHCSML